MTRINFIACSENKNQTNATKLQSEPKKNAKSR